MSKRYPTIPLIFISLPIVLYWIVFFQFRYNVNYIAFDDTLILSIIPSFEGASLYERWKLLSGLFPEHRLIFSRSIVLLTYKLFGKVDLTYLMTVANVCYTACLFVFYRAFTSFKLSLWYFVPVAWIWMSIQAFENMFWGVSSLCNFGVLLFGLNALYYAAFEEKKPWKAILFAIIATFSYGNGLFVFPIILVLFWLIGEYKLTLYTGLIAIFIAVIYFIDFTPITQNLDLTNPEQLKQGFFGLFDFIGSVGTIAAYEERTFMKYAASFVGMGMTITLLLLFRKQLIGFLSALFGKPVTLTKAQRFVLVLALFVFITALATTYKRIPTDTFDGMFKGRYRMYSIMTLIAVYLGALATISQQTVRVFIRIAVPGSILFWSVITYFNVADIINNQRAAIAQEFNARYNADWLGLDMFSMDQAHYEKIRSYYQSDDPLASQWPVTDTTSLLSCKGQWAIDTLFEASNQHLYIQWTGLVGNSLHDYQDGHYLILKSAEHVYAIPPRQQKRPFVSFLKDGNYMSDHLIGIVHTATIRPGTYQLYVLESNKGQNTLYCTDRSWIAHE